MNLAGPLVQTPMRSATDTAEQIVVHGVAKSIRMYMKGQTFQELPQDLWKNTYENRFSYLANNQVLL